jgi:hypothetical protein
MVLDTPLETERRRPEPRIEPSRNREDVGVHPLVLGHDVDVAEAALERVRHVD